MYNPFENGGSSDVSDTDNIGATARLSQLILDSNPLAVIVIGGDMKFIDCNAAALRFFEITDKRELLDNFFLFSAPIQTNGMFAGEFGRELVDKVFSEGEVISEWMHRTINGEPIPCEVTLKKIDQSDDGIVIVYIRDLRDEIKTQAEVREMTERNKIMIDATPICFVFFNDEFSVVDCNPAALSLFGMPTIKSFADAFFTLSPKYQKDGKLSSESYKTNMQRAFNEGSLVFEWDHLTASGQAMPVEVTFVRVEYKGGYRLAGYFRDLREYRAMLAEMQLAENKLREAKEIAETSTMMKSRFLANMSHEIRTPMNAILGITEIQLQSGVLTPETEEALNMIHESGNLLMGIINDILDLSKIEAGKMEIIPVVYDMPSLISEVSHLNRLRYDSKPIEFILEIDENTPLNLFGDELRIEQILNNILSNAFKYTDSGTVTLTVFSESASGGAADNDVLLTFSVRDTGQGMTTEQLHMLYDEYTRFHSDANRTTVGTGLGMSITKRLIDLMNGGISAESELNKGSVFTVRLPQKRVDSFVCGRETVEQLKDFRYRSLLMRKNSHVLREYMPYGSVLVVDDVESNLHVSRGMLLPYGLKVETASSGFEAVEKIKNGSVYDIIFMDHMMPRMDGIETTAIIRGMGYKYAVVALTANALVGQAEIYMQKGFDGFISKPIDSRELNMMLNKHIRDKKPSELVQAARREQREKGAGNTPAQNKGLSDIEKYFAIDARRAAGILENIRLFEINAADAELFEITVHGMKSALANIGENELSEIAYRLEQAIKARDHVVIEYETPAFVNGLNGLIKKITEKEENGEAMIYLTEKLLDIKAACAAYNMNAAKALMSELMKKTWSNQISDDLDEINVHLLHNSFEKAAAAAQTVAEGL